MPIQNIVRDGGNLLVGIVLMAALAPVGTCGAEPIGETAQASSEVADEGTENEKKSLNQLRRERDKAEENFFAVFNTINSTDEYDVKCKYESSLATRRKQQVCTPKFAKKIRASATSDMMTEGQWDAPSPPESLLAKQKESMRQEITELLSTHEEFRRVFNDFAFAKQAYESALTEQRSYCALNASNVTLRENRKAIFESAEMAEIFQCGNQNPEDLNEVSRLRYRLLMQNVTETTLEIYTQTLKT